MKFLLAIIPIAASLYSFIPRQDPLTVEGELVVHGHQNKKCRFELLVKGDGQLLDKTDVAGNGGFSLKFSTDGRELFDFFYVDSHHSEDTIYLKSFRRFEASPVKLTFYTYKGVIAVDDEDRVVCPKCGRSEYVSPIKQLPGYFLCDRDRIKF